MSAQLIFDPTKVASLKCPFTFLIKTTSKKEVKFKYEAYTVENIHSVYEKDYDQNTRNVLGLLTEGQLKNEKSRFKSHYRKLNLKSGIEQYTRKYLMEYYLKSFRQIFNVLSEKQRL